MNLWRLFNLFVFTFVLHGCAYLQSMQDDLPQQVNRWITEEHYAHALDTLNHVKPDHKNYARLMRQKKRIQRLVKELENRTIVQCNKLVQQNKWNKAAVKYEAALEKLPDSKSLQKAEAKFILARDAYLKELEIRLLINKGEWLSKNASLHSEVKRTIPDDYQSVAGIRDYEDDLQDTLNALVSCTETATRAGKLKLARQCMILAEKAGNKPLQSEQVKHIKKQLAITNQALILKQNTKTQRLIDELKTGYSHENLQRANDHLGVLLKQDSRNKQWLKLRTRLEKRVNEGIRQNMEAGRHMYSSGKIEEALDTWLNLQAIAPDNQKLAAHIERAKRVLSKLQRLHEEGPRITPPIGVPRRPR